ncbi:hypothetical protein EDD17DRAFT_405556 [Pisolithus thermaeus]|nr:hypothetical protein EDD17DRAFT_405556 [Pisolithus thermaeus]
MTTFYNAPREDESPEATRKVSSVKYNRQLDTPSMVEDIKALQVTLDATENMYEQRALEEDVTGKILWLLWCGICAEVDELLPKVVNYIQREGAMRGLLQISMVNPPSTEPSDDQAHLQRVMYDAGADISKYQLWVDGRAREQAKWSGTNRGTPTLDDQGTTPSASRQAPSTAAV